MNIEKLYYLEIDELEQFINEVEKKAEQLEVTVDYYIMEFL